MGFPCAISGCPSKSGRDKMRFYTVPAVVTRQCERTKDLSTRRRQLWIKRLNRPDLDDAQVNSNTRVCEKHFVSGKPSQLFEEESVDWAPSIGVFIDDVDQEEEDMDGSFRTETSSPVDWANTTTNHEEHEQEDSTRFPYATCQTELTRDDIIDKEVHEQIVAQNVALKKENEQLGADNVSLRLENQLLKAKICDFSEEQLCVSDVKVKFYTGLPTFKLLKLVFNLVSAKVDYTSRNALSKFQEFMVVMMRLRLNLMEQDLAFRFGVCQATISNICWRWLRIMALRLRKLILWPEREVLHKTMPECFRAAFGNNVAVIIDCFEVFIDRPSSLLPRAETWSQYKHHNTIKFLVGIAPQGTVSFISRAWVGRASDKCITENCGILEKLLPGDVVLADRGFTIEDSVGMYRAKLNIPAFTKGRPQLPAEEIQATREIANVRIHVERVIGLVRRKFTILRSTLPVEYLTPSSGDTEAPIDHIVNICCALTNLCASVIPLTISDSLSDLNTSV